MFSNMERFLLALWNGLSEKVAVHTYSSSSHLQELLSELKLPNEENSLSVGKHFGHKIAQEKSNFHIEK